METTWKTEFAKFLVSGNIFDVAIGTIVGTAVNPLVKSLIDDLVMPPFGVVVGGMEFEDLFFILKEGEKGRPYKTREEAKKDGAVIVRYGLFVNKLVNFLIVATVAFGFTIGVKKLRTMLEKEKQEQLAKRQEERALFKKGGYDKTLEGYVNSLAGYALKHQLALN